MLEFLGVLASQLAWAAVAAVVAVPFVLWRRRIHRTDRSRLLASGRRATGKVIEVWRDGQGWNVTYEFTPENSTSLVTRTETFEEVSSQPSVVGEVVQVVYEHAPPHHSAMVVSL